jgi:hypothetical protein
MSLNKNTLKSEIIKITDASNPIHEGFPKDITEAASRWSLAIDKYASQMEPTSSTFSAAKGILETALLQVVTGGTNAFITAFTQYVASIAGGQSTGVPPPTPIVLQPSFNLGLSGSSADEVAQSLADTIDTWFRTGTAINTTSSNVENWH